MHLPREVESFYQHTPVACSFYSRGCKSPIPISDISTHESTCHVRGIKRRFKYSVRKSPAKTANKILNKYRNIAHRRTKHENFLHLSEQGTGNASILKQHRVSPKILTDYNSDKKKFDLLQDRHKLMPPFCHGKRKFVLYKYSLRKIIFK